MAAANWPFRICAVAALRFCAKPTRYCASSSLHGSGQFGSPVAPRASAYSASSVSAEPLIRRAQQPDRVAVARMLRQETLEDLDGLRRLSLMQRETGQPDPVRRGWPSRASSPSRTRRARRHRCPLSSSHSPRRHCAGAYPPSRAMRGRLRRALRRSGRRALERIARRYHARGGPDRAATACSYARRASPVRPLASQTIPSVSQFAADGSPAFARAARALHRGRDFGRDTVQSNRDVPVRAAAGASRRRERSDETSVKTQRPGPSRRGFSPGRELDAPDRSLYQSYFSAEPRDARADDGRRQQERRAAQPRDVRGGVGVADVVEVDETRHRLCPCRP